MSIHNWNTLARIHMYKIHTLNNFFAVRHFVKLCHLLVHLGLPLGGIHLACDDSNSTKYIHAIKILTYSGIIEYPSGMPCFFPATGTLMSSSFGWYWSVCSDVVLVGSDPNMKCVFLLSLVRELRSSSVSVCTWSESEVGCWYDLWKISFKRINKLAVY